LDYIASLHFFPQTTSFRWLLLIPRIRYGSEEIPTVFGPLERADSIIGVIEIRDK
jgi:hypothetical protein